MFCKITKLVFLLVVIKACISDANKKRVVFQLYYETLCPYAIKFMTSSNFRNSILTFGSIVDIQLYPYGNAETKTTNGTTEIICQHGPQECYGNKLHACALNALENVDLSTSYAICLMDGKGLGFGSDDATADDCAKSLKVDSTPIKACAGGEEGFELLKHHGEETDKAFVYYSPWVEINGVRSNKKNITKDICDAFLRLENAVVPHACK